jgi:hypothetical protein
MTFVEGFPLLGPMHGAEQVSQHRHCSGLELVGAGVGREAKIKVKDTGRIQSVAMRITGFVNGRSRS